MTKSASITLICIICAIALFFGVCSCLPDGLEYGNYNVYHSPINLIQGDSMFNDSIIATYKVKLDDEATLEDVASTIRSRLGLMYGRYFCDVQVNSNEDSSWNVSVKVPVTANSEDVSATSILSNVTTTGKVEFLSSSTYSESAVLFDATSVASMRTQRFAYGDASYYILNIKLNKEGQAIASENLTSSSSSYSAYLAVDGTVAYGAVYGSDGRLQIYTSSDAQCAQLKGLIKSGALCGTLTQVETFTADESADAASIGGLIFAIVCAVVVLGSWIFYIVRYKLMSLAAIMSQLIAVVVFIMFSGLAYFSILNIASAIAIILGYGMMSAFTCLVLEKIRNYSVDKTFATARYKAFSENNMWNCIVHGIVLVVGIILWLIPTGVTAPIGNVLVYSAVLSFAVTMGLNRLFTSLVAPLGGLSASDRV